MKRITLVLAVVLAIALLFPGAVLAQSGDTGGATDIVALVEQLIEQVLGLDLDVEQFVGVAALVAVAVNILKQVKVNGSPIIPDGYGGLAALVGEVVVVIVAAIVGYTGYDFTAIDTILITVAQLTSAVVALVLTSLVVQKAGRALELPLFKERESG